MALILCPECGREISDKAVSCPGCGYPIIESQNQSQEDDDLYIINNVSVNLRELCDKFNGDKRKTAKELCRIADISFGQSCNIIGEFIRTKYLAISISDDGDLYTIKDVQVNLRELCGKYICDDRKAAKELSHITGIGYDISYDIIHDFTETDELEEMIDEVISEKYEEKFRLKQLKKDKISFCPKCHSTSIDYQGKVSIGRAAVGGMLAGRTGAVLGGLTGKKGYAVCLNCGKRWKI